MGRGHLILIDHKPHCFLSFFFHRVPISSCAGLKDSLRESPPEAIGWGWSRLSPLLAALGAASRCRVPRERPPRRVCVGRLGCGTTAPTTPPPPPVVPLRSRPRPGGSLSDESCPPASRPTDALPSPPRRAIVWCLRVLTTNPTSLGALVACPPPLLPTSTISSAPFPSLSLPRLGLLFFPALPVALVVRGESRDGGSGGRHLLLFSVLAANAACVGLTGLAPTRLACTARPSTRGAGRGAQGAGLLGEWGRTAARAATMRRVWEVGMAVTLLLAAVAGCTGAAAAAATKVQREPG